MIPDPKDTAAAARGTCVTTEYQKNLRLRKLRITADFLLDLCKAGEARWTRVMLNALPDDVRAVGAQYDVHSDCWELGVTSETFSEIEASVTLPVLDAPVWELVTESEAIAALRARCERLEEALNTVIDECDHLEFDEGRSVPLSYVTYIRLRAALAEGGAS